MNMRENKDIKKEIKKSKRKKKVIEKLKKDESIKVHSGKNLFDGDK